MCAQRHRGGVGRSIPIKVITWEFPAKSFVVSLSSDGLEWSDTFATDTNMMNVSHIPLGYQYAAKAKITMHEVRWCLHHIDMLSSSCSTFVIVFVVLRACVGKGRDGGA